MTSDELKNILLSFQEAGTFHLTNLIQHSEFRFTKNDPYTIRIVNSLHPVFLINEHFIPDYCKSKEHIFVFFFHEILYLIFKDTFSFPNRNEKDHFLMESFINSSLSNTLKEERFVSFFVDFNTDRNITGSLLRPIGEKTPKEMFPLIQLLKECTSTSNFENYKSTYERLYSFYEHKTLNSYLAANDYSNKNWTESPFVLEELDDIKQCYWKEVDFKKEKKMISQIKDFLNQIGISQEKKEKAQAFIYLEGSFSLYEKIKPLLYLFHQPYCYHNIRLFTFSREVKEITYQQYKEGDFEKNDSNINDVFDHYFSFKEKDLPKKILIISDDPISSISFEKEELLKKNKIQVYEVSFQDCISNTPSIVFKKEEC